MTLIETYKEGKKQKHNLKSRINTTEKYYRNLRKATLTNTLDIVEVNLHVDIEDKLL